MVGGFCRLVGFFAGLVGFAGWLGWLVGLVGKSLPNRHKKLVGLVGVHVGGITNQPGGGACFCWGFWGLLVGGWLVGWVGWGISPRLG